jgi:hypothetical protein
MRGARTVLPWSERLRVAGWAALAALALACSSPPEALEPVYGLVAPWSDLRIPAPAPQVLECTPRFCELHHPGVLVPALGERYVRVLERQGFSELRRHDGAGAFHAELEQREQTIYLGIRTDRSGATVRLSFGAAP